MSETEDDAQRKLSVEQFCHVTGANPETAKNILEACNWNLELAVNMHVDSVECLDPVQVAPDLNAPSTHPTASSSATLSSSVIQSENSDQLRAPIPPVRQVLVEDGYNHIFRTRNNHYPVYDAFRNFQEEANLIESYQRENENEEDDEDNRNGQTSKKRTLEDLFRPPIDLIHRGTLESAKEEGSKRNKWLMVNIQNVQEFACQVLNRDIWSNQAIKSIISEHFIFWQVYHDTNEGQRYMQFYNVRQFPYVAILDPRTGEMLRSWNVIDSVMFCDVITEFLHEFPSPHGDVKPIPETTKASNTSILSAGTSAFSPFSSVETRNNIYEANEEMQLRAAIAASLKESLPNRISDDSDDFETFDSDTEDDVKIINKKQNVKLSNEDSSSIEIISKEETEDVENYQKYLGTKQDAQSVLVIRYPNGEKEQISFPSDSKLKALFLFISSKGYSMNDYDLVTNFPKRNLSDLSSTDTLSDVGLSRENIFIQHKS